MAKVPSLCKYSRAKEEKLAAAKDKLKLIEYNQNGHVTPPKKDSRVDYQDSDPFHFVMYVDIHDFLPQEIMVEIVDGAMIVKANHEVDFKNTTNNQMHDESRSISERYTLPTNLNMSTLRWNLTPDKTKICVMAQKYADFDTDTISRFRNVEKRETVVEREHDAPLIYLQSFPQPFPGHEQDQSSFARNVANNFNSSYTNYTGYNASNANFPEHPSSYYPSYQPYQQYYQ